MAAPSAGLAEATEVSAWAVLSFYSCGSEDALTRRLGSALRLEIGQIGGGATLGLRLFLHSISGGSLD